MEPSLIHILSALVWATLLGLVGLRTSLWGPTPGERRLFSGLFFLKLLVGIGVWAVYTFYYTDPATADIYRFFHDSEIVYSLLFEKPGVYLNIVAGIGGGDELLPYYDLMNNWYKSFDDGFINENRTLIRANALLLPLTGGSYFGNLVLFSFLGVWAQRYLLSSLGKVFTFSFLPAFVLLNLWPSELFWTSALMKEPLLMGGMALCVGAAVRLRARFSVTHGALFSAGILLTLFSKFYVGIALLFPFLVYFSSPKKSTAGQLVFSYLALGIVLLGLLHYADQWFPEYNIPGVIAAKKQAFANVAEATGAGSAFYIPPMEPTVWGMMQLAPQGLVNALFRPFPQDASGIMEWAAVLENMLFAGLMLFLLFQFRKKNKNLNLCLTLLFFSLLVLVLGGITVNISGALMRYKMPVLPYLSFALFLASKYAEEIPKPIFSDTE